MNHEFQHLNQELRADRIDGREFYQALKSIGEFREDLLEALNECYQNRDWTNLSRLLWAITLVPDRRFVPLLCELLDNHRRDGYMEAIAESLSEIRDERSIPCIKRCLNYHVYGDDSRQFNLKLIDALFRIGTREAVEVIEQGQTSPDEIIREYAEEFMMRLRTDSDAR